MGRYVPNKEQVETTLFNPQMIHRNVLGKKSKDYWKSFLRGRLNNLIYN